MQIFPELGGSAMPANGLWPLVALLSASLISSCTALPPRSPINPQTQADAFAARRLEEKVSELPKPTDGWDGNAWFSAPLALNPQLAEARSAAIAVAAGERTAAERPNPNLNLFAEYVNAATGS